LGENFGKPDTSATDSEKKKGSTSRQKSEKRAKDPEATTMRSYGSYANTGRRLKKKRGAKKLLLTELRAKRKGRNYRHPACPEKKIANHRSGKCGPLGGGGGGGGGGGCFGGRKDKTLRSPRDASTGLVYQKYKKEGNQSAAAFAGKSMGEEKKTQRRGKERYRALKKGKGIQRGRTVEFLSRAGKPATICVSQPGKEGRRRPMNASGKPIRGEDKFPSESGCQS